MAVTWGTASQALNLDYAKLRDQRDMRREQIKQEQLRTKQAELETDSMELKFQALQKQFDDQLDADFLNKLSDAMGDIKEGKGDAKLISLLAPIPKNKDGSYARRVSPLQLHMFGDSYTDPQKYMEGKARQLASGNPNARPEELAQQRYDGLEQWMRMTDDEKRVYANKYRQQKQMKAQQMQQAQNPQQMQNPQQAQQQLGPNAQPQQAQQPQQVKNPQQQLGQNAKQGM